MWGCPAAPWQQPVAAALGNPLKLKLCWSEETRSAERSGPRPGRALLGVVDEVAAGPVWAEADGVEGAA